MRDMPAFSAYFLVYETLKRHYSAKHEKISSGHLLLAGGCAGMAAWSVSYPQDVVKSLMQSNYRYILANNH